MTLSASAAECEKEEIGSFSLFSGESARGVHSAAEERRAAARRATTGGEAEGGPKVRFYAFNFVPIIDGF